MGDFILLIMPAFNRVINLPSYSISETPYVNISSAMPLTQGRRHNFIQPLLKQIAGYLEAKW